MGRLHWAQAGWEQQAETRARQTGISVLGASVCAPGLKGAQNGTVALLSGRSLCTGWVTGAQLGS